MGLLFFFAQNRKRESEKMKNIEEKILLADEEIKQLQNKRKKAHQSAEARGTKKREIDAFMKKEEYLKVSLPKARTLLYHPKGCVRSPKALDR